MQQATVCGLFWIKWNENSSLTIQQSAKTCNGQKNEDKNTGKNKKRSNNKKNKKKNKKQIKKRKKVRRRKGRKGNGNDDNTNQYDDEDGKGEVLVPSLGQRKWLLRWLDRGRQDVECTPAG